MGVANFAAAITGLLLVCLFVAALTKPSGYADPQTLVPVASPQPTTQNMLVGTELINYYSMTTEQAQTFVNTVSAQGIPIFTCRLNAMNEFQDGTSMGIDKTKEVITYANSLGINVCVDLHTWYTTWDNYFDDSASNYEDYRSQYLTYVTNVVSSFADCNVYAFMVLNEPQAQTASNSENNFILDCISTAKQETSKPVSVRFMCGYSPSTGHYSPLIDTACDYICRNTYWDPRQASVSVYGASEAKLLTAQNNADTMSKEFWVTEFGKTNSAPAEQEAYVEAFVSYAGQHGFSRIFCWVCQPLNGSDESYNLFNGFTPYPAWYKLK